MSEEIKCAVCNKDIKPTNRDYEGYYEDYGFIYCNKLCRKSHEKQLISDGRIKVDMQGYGMLVLKDQQYKDVTGETVWFPKDGRPYFDQGLRRVFHSPQQKAQFLREHKIVSDGSSDGSKQKFKSTLEIAREIAREDGEKKGEKNARR